MPRKTLPIESIGTISIPEANSGCFDAIRNFQKSRNNATPRNMNHMEQKSTSRRDAIKSIAVAGAGLMFSPNSLLAATRQKKTKLGIALVGLGYYSTDLLAPALQQTTNCYLAGIVTGTPSKAETWKAKYNIPDKNIYNYQSFEQIANNDDIDVIYIVLPPSMHKEYVIRAANIGKHVFCEKPMAMTAGECKAMIEACNKNKRKLAIGYRLQHEPNTQACSINDITSSKPFVPSGGEAIE